MRLEVVQHWRDDNRACNSVFVLTNKQNAALWGTGEGTPIVFGPFVRQVVQEADRGIVLNRVEQECAERRSELCYVLMSNDADLEL